MPVYNLSYAYDVPHYADFTIEAKNAKEALAIAKRALEQGKFSSVTGSPCIENQHSDRVFCSGRAEAGEHAPMEELRDFGKA